ncbi:hypothetical protein [Desulfobulbus propionicus]
MTKVFEPESKGIHNIFEPEIIRNDFATMFNDRGEVESILSGYSTGDLQRLLNEEVGKMDERAKRQMLLESGTVKNFLRRVMGRVVVRLVSDKLVEKYGPSVMGALGLGGASMAVASRTDLFSNLSAEQQDLFAPFLERMSFFDGSEVAEAAELIEPSEVIEATGGVLEWLEVLFS